MAKPVLYYVLHRASYGRGFNVLAVTSEKGRQVYGRDECDGATHISKRAVLYRFPEGAPPEYARAAGKRAEEESRKHDVGLRQARAELSRLEDVRTDAMLNAAKGIYTSAGDRRAS